MSTDQEGESPDQTDPLSDPEEREVLYSALNSFRLYRRQAHYNVTHLRRQSFYSLPSAQIDVLSGSTINLPATFRAIDECIDENADIAEAILEAGLVIFGIHPDDESWQKDCSPLDLDKARSTIRQIYRDWSDAGAAERQACYTPIVSVLNHRYNADPPSARARRNVLVPGAGLGRLVFDLVREGYCVEGNEISYHQTLASNYLLNFTRQVGQHTLYPWALNFSNHRSRANQLRGYAIPDVHPSTVLMQDPDGIDPEIHYSERMGMGSGDFCVTYRQPEYKEMFDVVATCFFIDTAPNVMKYFEAVKNCLKPGGIWINLGPLLWHFESGPTPAEQNRQGKGSDSMEEGLGAERSNGVRASGSRPALDDRDQGIGEPGSYELSNEEVLVLLDHFGFRNVQQTEAPASGYIQDPHSMLHHVYHGALWTAEKPSS